MRPLAVEDEVGQPRATPSAAPSRPPTISKRHSGRSRASRRGASMSNQSSTAPDVADGEPAAAAPGSAAGEPAKSVEVAGVGQQARVRGSRPPCRRAAARRSRRRGPPRRRARVSASARTPGAIGREALVRVEAVVDDPPAEALAQRRGQRRPEGRLRRAARRRCELEPRARRGEASSAPPSVGPSSAPVGGVLAARRPSIGRSVTPGATPGGLAAARRCPRAIRRRRAGRGARAPRRAAAAAGAGSVQAMTGRTRTSARPARARPGSKAKRASSTGGLRMPSSRSVATRRRSARRQASGTSRRPSA